jgi:hypothetical protein
VWVSVKQNRAMPFNIQTTLSRYGASWKRADWDDLEIEKECIRRNGSWKGERGQQCGAGLFAHYANMQKVLWPEDYTNRWTELALRRMVEEEIVVFMGCSDSGKTYGMSKFVLCDYWCFPNDTLWIVSSTEYRGAELRIWGAIKRLFNRARERFPYLDGVPLEGAKAIATDKIDDNGEVARTIQRGLVVVPSKKGNQAVGLSAFIGVKSPRLRHAGDEVSVMEPGFLDAYSNWYGKENFKGIMCGNPTDLADPLCRAAQPPGGWSTFVDTEKTQEWRSQFYDAWVVAFDGRDSPNLDYPDSEPVRFKEFIGRKKINGVKKSEGENSLIYYSQVVGKPSRGLIFNRVLTEAVCIDGLAFDEAVWAGSPRKKVFAIDPAYGGGDRCVAGYIEIGKGRDDEEIIRVNIPVVVPINPASVIEPEDQIALYVKQQLTLEGIPASQCFYDSFGRGTVGYAFSKLFGDSCPVPVDSGAMPTERPVRFDLFAEELDLDGKQRLKTCREHYSKFITEMWFSVRETIQGKQMRELPKDVMEEGCLRIYKMVKGNRYEVESKEDMKERIRKSPDLFDWLAVAVEGARRIGFKIKRIGGDVDNKEVEPDYFETEAREYQEAIRSGLLKHV